MNKPCIPETVRAKFEFRKPIWKEEEDEMLPISVVTILRKDNTNEHLEDKLCAAPIKSDEDKHVHLEVDGST